MKDNVIKLIVERSTRSELLNLAKKYTNHMLYENTTKIKLAEMLKITLKKQTFTELKKLIP